MRSQSGAATVEHAAISLLIALLLAAAVAALASGAGDGGRELGSALGRKLRCAAVGPGPCWRDPLTLAYGRSLAGAVRALAPGARARAGPDGEPLLPVDFRLCRSTGLRPRRVAARDSPPRTGGSTEFVSVAERRGRTFDGNFILVVPSRARLAVGRAARKQGGTSRGSPQLRCSTIEIPALVPLETLDGRNQYEWAPGEEPPWRWRVDSVYPGIAELAEPGYQLGLVVLHHPEPGGELEAAGQACR